MGKLGKLFAKKLVYIFPSIRREEEAIKEIEKESQNLDDIMDSAKTVEQKVMEVRDGKDRVEGVISECSKIKENELDGDLSYDADFLQGSMKVWDSADRAFMAILVCFLVFSNFIVAPWVNENGRKLHEGHSKKPLRKNRKQRNRYHTNMPGDKLPWKGDRGGNSKQYRYGDQKNILKRGYGHRHLFGHDWFKPWEMFKNVEWDKVDVKKVFGSKRLGLFIKQSYHMFFDSCSEDGRPVSGSTYFIKAIDQLEDKIKKNNPNSKVKLFETFFTIHLEDVIASKGINGAIYVWNRIRQHIDNRDMFEVKSILKDLATVDMSKRTFKEYEMGIYANTLIVSVQLSPLSLYRGKINWASVHSLGTNIFQYARLQKKWSTENRKMLLSLVRDISKNETPENYRADLLSLCDSSDIDSETDFYELCIKILDEGDTENEN